MNIPTAWGQSACDYLRSAYGAVFGKSSGRVHYFTYGSNMSQQRLQDRIGAATLIGPAVLHGWRFAFNKRGGDGTGKANIVLDRSSKVQGVVYHVTDEQLKRLDHFEGAPNHYLRHPVHVESAQGKQLQAITYVAHQNFLVPDKLKPSKEYYELVERGALENKLNPSTVAHIRKEALLT